MSLEYDDETQHVIAVWLERFGEPPAIMGDLKFMWSLLDAARPAEVRSFDEEARESGTHIAL